MARKPSPSLGTILEALPIGIALTLLVALPSFMDLGTRQVFEEPKSLLLRAAALMALPGTWVLWRREDPRHLLGRPIVSLFLALIGALLLSTVIAGAGHDAVFGAYVRRHGLITWIALTVLFAAMIPPAREKHGREVIVRAVMIGAVWPSVYVLFQGAGIDWVDWAGSRGGYMSGSTFGGHVMLGGYLALVIPLTLSEGLRGHRAWLALAALQAAALVASGSRGAMVALAAALATLLAIVLWQRAPKRIAIGVTAAAVLALIAVAALPPLRPAAVVEQLNPRVGSARVRILIWQDVIDVLAASGPRLWLGHGMESLRKEFPKHYSAELGYLEQIDAIPDRAHNETLDMLVSAGVVGAVLQLAFLGSILWGALRIDDPWLQAGLAAAVIGHAIEIQFGIATVCSRLALLAVAAVIVGGQVPRDAAAGTHRPTYAWLLSAACIGALSPWLSMLPRALNQAPASGTEAQFIDHLRRLSVSTPALYLVFLTIAFGLARLLATSRSRSGNWWQVGALVAAALAAVPLSIVPSRADAFASAGAAYAGNQRWPESAMAFGAATRDAPIVADYQAELGRTSIEWAMRGEPARRDQLLQQAKTAYERAIALDESDPAHARHLAGYFRIQAATTQGSAREQALMEADRIYARATTMAPSMTPLWVEWAWVDVDRQRPADALQKLETALALDPRRVDARLLHGDLLLRNSDGRSALRDFSAVLARDARNIMAWRGRVAALIQMRRVDNARAAVAEALGYAPTDAPLLAQRAGLEGK